MKGRANTQFETTQPAELRRQAEDQLRAREIDRAEVTSVADARALLHELEVHQIELEMQNEELRRARMEAEEAKEKYLDLFDFAPAGHFVWDREGRIAEINLAGAALLGLERSRASGRRFGQFVAAEFRSAFDEFLERVLKTDAKQTCEIVMEREGTSSWVLVEGIAAQEPPGQERFCRATVIDISAQKRAGELAAANQALEAEMAVRKQAEEVARESSERLALAITGTRIGMFEWELSTSELSWSSQIRQLLGLEAAASTTTTTTRTTLSRMYHYHDWAERVHPEDLVRVEAEIRRARINHLPYEAEYRVVWPDGSVHWLADRGVFQYSAEGEAQRLLGIVMDITEGKRAEDRLRADLTALTRMQEVSGKVVGGAGIQPLLQEVIDAAVAIAGAERGTLQLLEGESLRIVAHHGHDAPFLKFFELAETRASVCGEATRRGERVVVPDVEESPLFAGTGSLAVLSAAGVRAVQSTPLMSRSGKLLGILTTQWGRRYRPDEHVLLRIDLLVRQASDLIEQARAEEALRQRTEELQTVLDTAPVAIWMAQDPECRVIKGNAYADELIMGTARGGNISRSALPSEAAVTYRVFRDGVELKPEDLPAQMATATGKPVPAFDMELVFPGGRELYLRAGAIPLFTAKGEVRGAIVAGLDVTPLRKAQEELQESERRFRIMADGTPLIIWVSDANGDNCYVNRAYREFFGVKAGEVQGQDWRPLVHPEDRAGYVEAVTRATREHKALRAQLRVRRHDGVWRWIESCAEPRFSASGEFLGLAGCCPDMTEQKEFQAELQRLVDERTARLHELVGELEHFSYTITHDLKSPLRAMRGFAEMASMAFLEGERGRSEEFLGRISTSADRMDHLIADALNYSRSVRQELPLEDVNAESLLRGILDTYPELQPDKARIVVEGRLPVVLANEAGLTQVFSNLLGNAVKFVKPGELPEIRVWAEAEVQGESRGQPPCRVQTGWVRIWVEDKGIGISKEMLPRVFDMFSRGNKDYEGTGIGLALVRKVAQRMGGKAGVESEEGRGSRFWIELKCGEAKLAFSGTTALPGAREESGTVLYVEDEEGDAIFMERACGEKGLAGKLRVVGDGRAAIDYLSGAGKYGDRGKYPVPTLVLLDLNLPQVGGFEVLRWMRNNPDYARLPVVVFSSSTREDDRVKARELGADEFVAKPSSGLEFGKVVEGLQQRWLGRGRRS